MLIKIVRSAILAGLITAIVVCALLLAHWWHFYSSAPYEPPRASLAKEVFGVFWRLFALSFFLTAVLRFLLVSFKRQTGLEQRFFASSFALCLTVAAYAVFDPREHTAAFVPAPTSPWLVEPPDLPKPSSVEYWGDSWLYPVTKVSSSAYYDDEYVTVKVLAPAPGLSEYYDETAKAESQRGAPFFINVVTKDPAVGVNLERLQLQEPCDPIRVGEHELKVVPYRFERPCSVEYLCFNEDQSYQFSTELSYEYSTELAAKRGVTDVLIVLQAMPRALRQCTLDFREAIKLPTGGIPGLKFRTTPWAYVPYSF